MCDRLDICGAGAESGKIISWGNQVVGIDLTNGFVAVAAGGNYELLGGFWPGGPLCTIDFEHFARFAQYWFETGPDLPADLEGL